MDRAADAMTATLAAMHPESGRRQLEPWEQDTLADCLDAAAAWQAGELDLNTAAHVGAIEYQGPDDDRPHPSPRYSRFLAITTTPRDDPRWAALDALIRTIVRKQMIVTTQGVYESSELHQHDRARQWIAQHDRSEAA